MLKFKYIPNCLTAFRIVCAIFILILYMDDGVITKKIFVVCMIAGVTDMLDGYLARRYQWVTATGKLLDPIADKLLTYTVLIMFVSRELLPFGGLCYVLLKDSMINIYRFKNLRNGVVSSAFRLGKYKTAYNSLVFTIVLASSGFPQLSAILLFKNPVIKRLLFTTLI